MLVCRLSAAYKPRRKWLGKEDKSSSSPPVSPGVFPGAETEFVFPRQHASSIQMTAAERARADFNNKGTPSNNPILSGRTSALGLGFDLPSMAGLPDFGNLGDADLNLSPGLLQMSQMRTPTNFNMKKASTPMSTRSSAGRSGASPDSTQKALLSFLSPSFQSEPSGINLSPSSFRFPQTPFSPAKTPLLPGAQLPVGVQPQPQPQPQPQLQHAAGSTPEQGRNGASVSTAETTSSTPPTLGEQPAPRQDIKLELFTKESKGALALKEAQGAQNATAQKPRASAAQQQAAEAAAISAMMLLSPLKTPACRTRRGAAQQQQLQAAEAAARTSPTGSPSESPPPSDKKDRQTRSTK